MAAEMYLRVWKPSMDYMWSWQVGNHAGRAMTRAGAFRAAMRTAKRINALRAAAAPVVPEGADQ